MNNIEQQSHKKMSISDKDFIVILTIDGTEYEEVEIKITDPHKSIRQLIFDIVIVLELPYTDNGGNPIMYLLGIDTGDDESGIIFEFEDENGIEQSLLDYNIYSGCHLHLVTVPIAGGSPYTGLTYLPYTSQETKEGAPLDKARIAFCPTCCDYLETIGDFCPRCGQKLRPLNSSMPQAYKKTNVLLNILQLPFLLMSSLFSFVIDKVTNSNNCDDSKCVFSSIFAPAEVSYNTHMIVQVYLHLYEETEKVKSLAQESDKNTERRDYTPLHCKLKKGDKVDVQLNIYGETLLMSDKKSVIWQGAFTKCSFGYFLPKYIDVNELSCAALLTVNEIPVGEMRFITRIVESPRKLNPKIIAHKYNKVFISYAHKDEEKVKSFHEGLKLAGIEHFFDRAYLKTGDIFPQVIQDYINSADLFVLFWSENASKSEYVDKERKQALERAFPQVKPQQEAKLSIYPMSIEPRAELPSDMKDNYHFGEI